MRTKPPRLRPQSIESSNSSERPRKRRTKPPRLRASSSDAAPPCYQQRCPPAASRSSTVLCFHSHDSCRVTRLHGQRYALPVCEASRSRGRSRYTNFPLEHGSSSRRKDVWLTGTVRKDVWLTDEDHSSFVSRSCAFPRRVISDLCRGTEAEGPPSKKARKVDRVPRPGHG